MAKSELKRRAEKWATEHADEAQALTDMLDRVSKLDLQRTMAAFVLAGAEDYETARQLIMESFPETMPRCSACDAYLDDHGDCPEGH